MQRFQRVKAVVFLAICGSMISARGFTQSSPVNESAWVKQNGRGKLAYKYTLRGDRIMDFSTAGYKGGGVNLPAVKTTVIIHPVPGDNTPIIQHAIDSVANLPVVNGFRGAVVLSPGDFNCRQTIRMDNSGIVLRGSGTATKIIMSGQPHVCISIMGDEHIQRLGKTAVITDAYVPSGVDTFTVSDAKPFSVGDEIAIVKPVTAKWVHFMGMDVLVRNGKPQTWIGGELSTNRGIKKIEGNRITVEVPLTDDYDKVYTQPGTIIQRIKRTGELQNIGLENFSVIAPEQSVTINQKHYSAIRTKGVADVWMRNIHITNTVNSIALSGRRISVDQVQILHTTPTLGAAKPADLSANGAQLLFNKCKIKGDNVFYLATGAKVSGPIVLLNCLFEGKGWIQPHQRWATGVLVDGCRVPTGGIDFMNRGEMGSGHGWAIGWAVAWNCTAASFTNQMPPGAYNWVIGCVGEKLRRPMPFDKAPNVQEGIYDSYTKAVAPKSLYLAQLRQRLGERALKNIGY